MPLIYLSLGSNLGDRKINLEKAIDLLSSEIKIQHVSSIYETDPEGYKQQPKFLNMVISGNTELEPELLLKFVKNIETGMGRVTSFPNAPRLIDIDILFYNNEILESQDLIIPHPRIKTRTFVLAPMAEIAPDFIHPVNGKSIKNILGELGKISGVSKIQIDKTIDNLNMHGA